MRPGWLGPLRGCPSLLTPFGLSFSPLVCPPPLFLFHSEGGPLTWVPPSSSSLSPLRGSLTHWPCAPARPDPPPPASFQALCAAVTTSDLAETQALLGCGAGVNCFSGDPEAPTPLALAEQAGQTLQMEFLRNNRTTGEGDCSPQRMAPPCCQGQVLGRGWMLVVGCQWRDIAL